jgi:hypothetical protein
MTAPYNPKQRPTATVADNSGPTHITVRCEQHNVASDCTPCGKHEGGMGWWVHNRIESMRPLTNSDFRFVNCVPCREYAAAYVQQTLTLKDDPEQDATIAVPSGARVVIGAQVRASARWQAIQLIMNERGAQGFRWSVDHDMRHTPVEWTALLADYTGRIGRTALDGPIDGPKGYRHRLAQVAAVALAAMECDLLQEHVVEQGLQP